MDDWQLLTEYAMNGSEEAFRSLVERYAGMVYHAALRQLGNSHAAEEVAQAVFTVLARKAGKIPRKATLSGWLFRATRFAVLNELRRNEHRARREQEAFAMQTTGGPDEADSIWYQISAHLDDALDALSASDREIVMIRFFENKSHRDLARALGVSEETTRKRLSRALDKLRGIFARRGIVVSSLALAAAFAARGAQAAPAGLVSSVAAAAAFKGTAGGSTLTLTKGILKLMAWTKLKTSAVVGAAVLLTIGITTVAVRHTPFPRAHTGPELPAEARRQLARQKAALRTIYLEYVESFGGPDTNYNHRVTPRYADYFDGARFNNHELTPGFDYETAFDGRSIWSRRKGDRLGVRQRPLAEAVASIRFRLVDWPFLEAAGLYAPDFPSELEHFSSLEPFVSHCLDQGDPIRIEVVGDNLRVTVETEDLLIAHVQKVNIDQYRSELKRTPNAPDWISRELANVQRMQAMKPTRTISLLLDASHGYAVAERDEWTAEGQKIVHVESDEWQFHGGAGIWLPNRCVASYYTAPSFGSDVYSTEPILVVTNELQRVEFGKQTIAVAFNKDPN